MYIPGMPTDQVITKMYLFRVLTRSLVAVQIASDLFEREKARSIQVYMSTFDAGIGQIRGELNSYAKMRLFEAIAGVDVNCRLLITLISILICHRSVIEFHQAVPCKPLKQLRDTVISAAQRTSYTLPSLP